MMDVQAWMRAAGARTGALVLLLALTGACASGPRLPQIDAAQADQFLFDRGTGYLENRNWLYAREYFRRLIDGYPRSPYRSRAKLGVGDSYIGENRTDSFILAANEFREFLQFFPVDPRADYAQYRLAYTYHRQMLSPQRDQTATKDAIRELQVFLDRYKESEYREEVVRLHRDARDRLSESEFRVGLLYFRTRWFQGALGRFSAAAALTTTASRLGPRSPASIARNAPAFSAASPPRSASRLERATPKSSGVTVRSVNAPFLSSMTRVSPLTATSSRPP
jgi:outer membrane protein assembly factor BamD